MTSIRFALCLLAAWLCPACTTAPPQPDLFDGLIPQGTLSATVQSVDDACAVQQPNLVLGATLELVIRRPGDAVEVLFPNTTLPDLTASSHQQDRFQTAALQVPISAQTGLGLCDGMRAQYYQGMQATDTQYNVLFRDDDSMPTGQCTEVPIPCNTIVTLSVPFCPVGKPCPATP